MGLDFDASEYCKKLKYNQPNPPYCCPVDKCGKSYKSIIGLQYHLNNYDHDNPVPVTPILASNKKRGRSRLSGIKAFNPNSDVKQTPKEAVTYCEAEKMVQYDMDGKCVKVSAEDEIKTITEAEYLNMIESGNYEVVPEIQPEPRLKLPEASFRKIENYNICDAPTRPNAYIRFIEKSVEELDGEVEYDVDEEDTMWLATINEKREEQGLSPVTIDTLELLMDRLEKESYFQATATGQSGVDVDDDAVCCICMDGECQNTNVILFCDMCNLAVHQDCYGVPYIPEGQWLCRRCLQSPSTPVQCVLCPNTGGAFKQTDKGQWAHVVCALWIPEVRFANTVFLEPIDSIETIPPARWRLNCYICKEKGVGACIQCHRASCYAAFHVTCAQQAGLHMKMDTIKNQDNDLLPISVQKSAYCLSHTPADAKIFHENSNNNHSLDDSRHKMKEARKLIAKKRSSAPLILIPTIPNDRVNEIASLVTIQKKSQFIQKLIAYWTLKRQYRNGVPLLRRLQSQGQNHSGLTRNSIDGSPQTSELYQQLKYWQCLRQDLERARLLCELVRKREKLKAALIKVTEEVIMLQINPLEASMKKLLDSLISKDTMEIFLEPVNVEEVPDYMDIVKEPMDLGTMRKKLENCEYSTLDEMESDFDLMIKNCLAYNNKDTIFYRAGIRMRDQGGPLFKAARRELEKSGLIERPPTKLEGHIVQEIDDELKELIKQPASDEILEKLLILADKAQALKNVSQRIKRVRQIRLEISKMRKNINKSKTESKMDVDGSQTEADEEEEEEAEEEEPKVDVTTKAQTVTPTKNINNNISPSGVNRRTAVLFTRKAQAALKRPTVVMKEESSCDTIQHEKINKSPKRTQKNSKRYPSRRSLDRDLQQNEYHHNHHLLHQKSPTVSSAKSPSKEQYETIPDSFRVYRANTNRDISESDVSDFSDLSGSHCSSCSRYSGSGSGSDFYTSSDEAASITDSEMIISNTDNEDEEDDDDDDDENNDNGDYDDLDTITKFPASSSSPSSTANMINRFQFEEQQQQQQHQNQQQFEKSQPLEPLQLVWAKCRGYPWYPALIIDPKTPKGFVYNGVPLPAPPQDVLNLRKNYTEEVFLVLFFDAKRTWQWLPQTKLELLGLDKELDQSKLIESRKPTERKAVRRAYQDALYYQSQVSDLEAQGPGAIM